MPILHIVNGDSTRAGLERSSVPGTFCSWSDVLHEGPVPAGTSPEEWRRIRVAYLVSQGYGPATEVEGQYAREDAAVDRWRDHDEVVLWFEHDLYDQLILIKHLARFGAQGANDLSRPRLSLVCDDTYLGPLKPEQFPPLYAMREPVTSAQIDLATRAWAAFCADEPRGLLPFAATPSRELPYLPGALRRHLEEFPSAENGLSRSEQGILRILSEHDRSPEEVFAALTATEERIFMGDATFWTVVRRLNTGPHPLVTLDVRQRPGRLPAGTLRITDTGRDVLAGRADQIALNGIDRWAGGVHLRSPRCWRWDGATLTIAD
jgi:hypothetical protein